MNTKLKWEKKLFSGTYSLFTEGTLCGYLKSNIFSDSSNAELKGQRYLFKTNGVFKRQTIIYELETFRNLGMITYDELGTKSILLIEGNVMFFRHDSFWQNSWILSDSTGNHIHYSANMYNGHIDSTTSESILILSGLFVADYYKKAQTVAFISLISTMALSFIVIF